VGGGVAEGARLVRVPSRGGSEEAFFQFGVGSDREGERWARRVHNLVMCGVREKNNSFLAETLSKLRFLGIS
jgi:hypothetical protein